MEIDREKKCLYWDINLIIMIRNLYNIYYYKNNVVYIDFVKNNGMFFIYVFFVIFNVKI